MATVRVRKLPVQTIAVQYKGWNVNRQEIAAFVAPYQDTGDPLFIQMSDPADSTVTAAVEDNVNQYYQAMRDNDWIVVGEQNMLMVMRPADYAKHWEQVAILTVGV